MENYCGKRLLLLFSVAILSVDYADASLSLFPLSPIVADSGDYVEIHCSSTSPCSAGFTWSMDATDGSSFPLDQARVQEHGDLRSTLTIYSVSSDDRGFYDCSCAGETIRAQLRVNLDAHYIDMPSTLVQNFTVGEAAEIHCPAFLGEPPGEMIWSRGNAFLSALEDPRYSVETTVLTIAQVQLSDSGVYHCVIDRDGQGVVSPGRNITVNVFDPSQQAPLINKSQSQDWMIWYEDPLDVPCTIVRGEEPISVTWYIGTSVVADSNRTLHREPKHYSSGWYECRASNSHGSDTFSVYIKVLAPPRPPSVVLPTMTAREGSVVILSYQTSPPPIDELSLKHDWKKHDGSRYMPVLLGGRISKNPLSGQLNIRNVSSSDAGEYQVNISNPHGSSVQMVRLVVEPLPTTTPPGSPPGPGLNQRFVFATSKDCHDLESQEEGLSTALEKELCRDGGCQVTQISCSSETSGQFYATLSQPLPSSFSLTVNGVTLTVEACTSDMCTVTPPSPKPKVDNNNGVISGVVVVLAVVLSTAVAIGVAVMVCRRRPAMGAKSAPSDDDVEAQRDSTPGASQPATGTASPTRPSNLGIASGPPPTKPPAKLNRLTPELGKYEACSPAMEVLGEEKNLRKKLSPLPRSFQRSLSCGATSNHQWRSHMVHAQ